MTKYILASASPRRKELLAQLGISFEIMVSDCEEIISEKEPEKVVEELSFQKAKDVVYKLKKQGSIFTQDKIVVIGADTVVAYESQIFGKPTDKEDAQHMLTFLSGKIHKVCTGFTFGIIEKHNDGKLSEVYKSFHETTEVEFVSMTQEEIEEYVNTGEPMDKAGSYGIQGQCGKFISRIKGDYYNVVGLPLSRLYKELKILQLL